MITNDERRRVAAALREKAGRRLFAGDYIEEVLWDDAYSGFSIDEAAKTYNRLADLIDPNGIDVMTVGEIAEFASPTPQENMTASGKITPPQENMTASGKITPPQEKYDRDAAGCDRDALLALADDLETYRLPISGIAVAEHIREACGEVVDG